MNEVVSVISEVVYNKVWIVWNRRPGECDRSKLSQVMFGMSEVVCTIVWIVWNRMSVESERSKITEVMCACQKFCVNIGCELSELGGPVNLKDQNCLNKYM